MAYHPRTKRPEDLKSLIQWLRYRVRQDDDGVLVITGPTGTGKSTLLRLLMRHIQDHPVEPDLNFIWAANQLLESARKLPEFSCLGVDEGLAAGGNRRRAMTSDNVNVMEHLNTCRTFHHVTLIASPQFADLDLAIQTRALGILEVYKRGHVRFHELVKAPDVMDRIVYPVPRFKDVFPDDRDHSDPEAVRIRLAYDELKAKYSHQGSDSKSPLMRQTIEEYRAIIRGVLEGQDTRL